MYNIWQDSGNRTRVAAIAARCATIELHTKHRKSRLLNNEKSKHIYKCFQYFLNTGQYLSSNSKISSFAAVSF